MATQITPQEQQYIDQIRAGLPQEVKDQYARDSNRHHCYFEELRRDNPEAYAESGRLGVPFYQSPLLPRDAADRLRDLNQRNNSSYFAMQRAAEEQARRLGVEGVPIADNRHFTVATMATLQEAQSNAPQCEAVSSAPQQRNMQVAHAAPASRATNIMHPPT